MDVNIRLTDKTDLLPLIRFFEQNDIHEVTRNFNPFPLNAKTAFEITQKKHVDRFYVSYFGKDIVGLAMLRGWEEGYEIPSFGILIDYRFHHKGIGKQLTVFALEEAKRLGCHKVRLSVFAVNGNALHLYESLDFSEISREPVFINGDQEIKIIMVREL